MAGPTVGSPDGRIRAFASVVGFTYAHLLPSWWPAYSDSYVTGPRIGVTWFSWVSVAAELGTALVLGLASVKVVAGPEAHPGHGRTQRVRN
jgi:hypothetical protein